MSKILVTPWMTGNPTRPGVYMRKTFNDARVFSRWTGTVWCRNMLTVEAADSCADKSFYQRAPWLGLCDLPQHAERHPGMCVCLRAARLQKPNASDNVINYLAMNLYCNQYLIGTGNDGLKARVNPFYLGGRK